MSVTPAGDRTDGARRLQESGHCCRRIRESEVTTGHLERPWVAAVDRQDRWTLNLSLITPLHAAHKMILKPIDCPGYKLLQISPM